MKANKLNVGDVKLMNKMIMHIRNVPLQTKFRKLQGDDWWLTTFVDASIGILPDGHRSTVGYLI